MLAGMSSRAAFFKAAVSVFLSSPAARSFSAQVLSDLRSAPLARAAASSIRPAPTCAAMRMSSGSTRRSSSLRHDTKWSTQATTV